jgi:hypothetical protein
VARPFLLRRGLKRSALPLLGSANLVHPGLRPNGPSNTASRHRPEGDRSARALQPSQIAGKALSTLRGKTNERAWREHLDARRTRTPEWMDQVSSSFPSRLSEADTSLLRPGSRNANGIPVEERTTKLGRMIVTDLRTVRLAIACGDRRDKTLHPSQIAVGARPPSLRKRKRASLEGPSLAVQHCTKLYV